MITLAKFAYKTISDKALNNIQNNENRKRRINKALDDNPMKIRLGKAPKQTISSNLSRDIVRNIAKGNSIEVSKTKAFRTIDNNIANGKKGLKAIQNVFKNNSKEANNAKSMWNKSKLNNKKLVLGGLVASSLIGLGINKLRKTRSDKGKKRIK